MRRPALPSWWAPLAARLRAWWHRLVPPPPPCPRCGGQVHQNPYGAVSLGGETWVTTWRCSRCHAAGYEWPA